MTYEAQGSRIYKSVCPVIDHTSLKNRLLRCYMFICGELLTNQGLVDK